MHRFPTGRLLMTPGAIEACKEAAGGDLLLGGVIASELLERHRSGDWGELCEEDKKENELSIEKGFRILSKYFLKTKQALYIITEADRSSTTILLPEEY